jgi:hypothetical protein
MENSAIAKTEREAEQKKERKEQRNEVLMAVLQAVLTVGLVFGAGALIIFFMKITLFAAPTVETYEIESYDTNGIYVKSENGGTQLKTYDNEDITFFPTDKAYDYMEVKKYNIGITVVDIYTSKQTDSISFAPKVENSDNSNSFLRNFLITFVVINVCLLIAKSRS